MKHYIKAVAVQGKAQGLIEDNQVTNGTTYSSEKIEGELTSNTLGIQNKLGYRLEEQDTGLTWVDGSKIYQKTIYKDYGGNSTEPIPTGVTNIKEVVWWEGVFHGNYPNTGWTMHLPYWLWSNASTYYGIYCYYYPARKQFEYSSICPGNSNYFKGRAYITFRYTKN